MFYSVGPLKDLDGNCMINCIMVATDAVVQYIQNLQNDNTLNKIRGIIKIAYCFLFSTALYKLF